MIAIVDYGMGNIESVAMAFKKLGYDICVTDDIPTLELASHIVLPGVGAFPAAMEEIAKRGLREPLRKLAGTTPLLGICLGMQLLFSEGEEGGTPTKGLDILPGRVTKMATQEILPHMGWNTLKISPEYSTFAPLEGKHVYFVHSYSVSTDKKWIVATADYGMNVTAIVKKNHVYGMQFHPEKSGDVGRELLKLFLKEAVAV
ncbi:glutamine amidotransferase [Pullulanibacillus pueri]|uniref:Imidazole glycerol phosphate synthase subunit HisH n=1 Tax=Pullulanibacillus pueri TaxID=1437324 RepID=A0A8J2ZUB1_9BACL|nr:imidazole glycerol phosphate synthase subunit HisH [Pullulanibacillus pueri]MBM7681074.1 glutamine amidotransferase [Pullulanibacillus pueri]GGH76945.1 imidazole glycerol phosphate synthase subunit HisH [Pullulanibacillus pueri]